MKKIFGLFLLALAFLSPATADAANRFLTCATTCTIDASNTAIWGAASGGTGASVPGSGDAVIWDTATCVGGTTCTATFGSGYNPTWQTITWGTCTASTTGCIIDATVNNPNITLSSSGATAFSGTGTGTRKWLAGTGAYNITQTGANGCVDMATSTNDQGSTFSGATWNCSGTTTSGRTFAGGAFSYGPLTINANTSRGSLALTGANTFASITVNGPNTISMNATTTVSGALTLNGISASSPVQFTGGSIDVPGTLSLGAASTATWVTFRAITTSGAAGMTASNCLDLGRNTFANGGSCNGPTGGASGGRIIGG